MAEICNVLDHGQVIDVFVALTRPSPLDSVIITGDENMALYLSLRRRGFGGHTRDMPDTEAAARHRSCHRPEPDCGACKGLAVPHRQFRHRSLDRISGSRLLDDDPTQAAADGFSNRSRCKVPARICSFRLPPWLLSDGASGVILPATTTSWLTGYMPRSSYAIR